MDEDDGHRRVIAVDIDGTLNYGVNRSMYLRKPWQRMAQILRELREDDNTVILYTSRNEARRVETEMWLCKNGFGRYHEYDDIVFGKLKYDVIIDSCSFNTSELITKECECTLEELGVDCILMDKIDELLAFGGYHVR